MIQSDITGQVFISPQSAALLSRLVQNGSIIHVEIPEHALGGNVIRMAGRTFTAAGLSGYSPGDSFMARVRILNGIVYLDPVVSPKQAIAGDVFATLGIPFTGLSAFILSYFRNLDVPFEQNHIRSIIKLASHFPGKEKKAAEAAMILESDGRLADIESVTWLLNMMEGHSDNTETGTAFLRSIQKKEGRNRYWLFLPFSRDINGRECSGSIRFLFDACTEKIIETRISMRDGIHSWEFELTEEACRFTVVPPVDSATSHKFREYLQSLLESTGITRVSYYDPGSYPSPGIKSIDLEI